MVFLDVMAYGTFVITFYVEKFTMRKKKKQSNKVRTL